MSEAKEVKRQTEWDVSLKGVTSILKIAKKAEKANDPAEALGRALMAQQLLDAWVCFMLDEGY